MMHYAVIAALFAPAALATIVDSTTALTCHAVASREGGLPEVCATNAYRDELIAYMNLSEVYLLEEGKGDTRFIDRVELVPDLGENSYTVGGGKAVLRMNSFLRIKDAKDLLSSLRTRMLLTKASAETNALLGQLALAKAPAHLNLDAPLKSFLDAPFLTADGRIIAPDASRGATESTVSAIATHPRELEAAAPGDDACVALRKASLDEKLRLEKEISELATARGMIAKATQSTPEAQPLDHFGGRPVALASAVAKSDCDGCFEAVHHCKAAGLLKGFVPTEGNCRKIIAMKACTAALPPLPRVPVELCRGTDPTAVVERWKKEQALKEGALRDTLTRLSQEAPESCTPAVDANPTTSL